jgi:Ser/Thr protein kinase RdoA (MazF antagonist)
MVALIAFAERSRRSQLLQLRKLAEAAARQFGLRDARVIPVQHWLNTTYQIIGDGQRYALHIQRAGQQNCPEVWSEMIWLQALRAGAVGARAAARTGERELEVPQPVLTVEGELLATVEVPQVLESRICVLFTWMEGRSLYRGLTPRLMKKAGEFLARMHSKSERFEPPEGFTRPRWDVPAFRGGALNVDMAKCRAHISAEQWDIIERMGEVVRKSLTAVPEERGLFGMIHADFHPGNLLFHKGEVRAIDFELCGWGYYLYDIAVMLSVLVGRHPNYEALRSGFLEGYSEVRVLSGNWAKTVDMFIAARKMIRSLWLAEQIGRPVWEGAESRVKQELDYVHSYLRNQTG